MPGGPSVKADPALMEDPELKTCDSIFFMVMPGGMYFVYGIQYIEWIVARSCCAPYPCRQVG